MADYLSRSFDFGVRIVQLARWLKEEGKEFPLTERLLECGTGVGISLRAAKVLKDRECFVRAIWQAEEVQFLLELMVKTNFVTQLQSEPLLTECKAILAEINSQKPL